MAQAIHVNGPAVIYVGISSASAGSAQSGSGPLKQLGITEDGADVEINFHDQPVMTDAAGPAIPADVQDMGRDANIRIALSVYDLDVMTTIVRLRGDAASEGVEGTGGYLLGTNNKALRLVIESTTDETWRFLTCVLRGPLTFRPATRYTVQRLHFYAWPYVGAGNSRKGAKLFDHTKG